MAGASAAKANQKNRVAAVAGRLAYLREEKFELLGFKSSDPTPTLTQARAMHNSNLRQMAKQKPTPSVTM